MSNNLSLKYTGNPFVDAGIFALKRKLKKPINEITKDKYFGYLCYSCLEKKFIFYFSE